MESVNTILPYWFCGNYKQFSGREQFMPFDQHEVIALIVPRPVYISSATDDRWSDPHGEFLGIKGAESVYELYGKQGVGCQEFPSPNHPCQSGSIVYHIRTGPHSVLPYDWEQFLKLMPIVSSKK